MRYIQAVVSDEVYHEMRVFAAKQNLTLGELIVSAIQEFLERRSEERLGDCSKGNTKTLPIKQ